MKPLTRKEWSNIKPGGRGLTREQHDRIEATIEAGGFAPEPITENQVKTWLYRDGGTTYLPHFTSQDLDMAVYQAGASATKVALHVESVSLTYVDYEGVCYPCKSPGSIARTVGALVYKKAHPGVGVSHLLGDM